MSNVKINIEIVRKQLSTLSNNPAIVPDGVPVPCLKNGGKFVIDAVIDITRSPIDESKLMAILKLAQVSPMWKGGDREHPKEYRPISLNSHIGTLKEMIECKCKKGGAELCI